MKEPELLKPVEAMSILRVSRSKLFKMMNSKTFPSLRVGRTLLIKKDSLLKWIDEQENKQTDETSYRNQGVIV